MNMEPWIRFSISRISVKADYGIRLMRGESHII